MNGTTGYYSIVQYCPDPMRKEVANVGVVLLCQDLDFLAVRMADDDSRIKEVFPRLEVDPEQLATELQFIARRLRVDRDDFKTVDALRRFAQTRASAMRLTLPLPTRVEEPDVDLNRLFERLVGDREPRRDAESRQPVAETLAANTLADSRSGNGQSAEEQERIVGTSGT